MGFSFLGLYRKLTLNPPSGILLSCAFPGTRCFIAVRIPFSTPEYQSISHWKQDALPKQPATAPTLLRFLHLSVPEHLDIDTPGYGFTLSGSNITAVRTDSLVCLRLTGVVRIRLWCRACATFQSRAMKGLSRCALQSFRFNLLIVGSATPTFILSWN
jgi:hypothetical protein